MNLTASKRLKINLTARKSKSNLTASKKLASTKILESCTPRSRTEQIYLQNTFNFFARQSQRLNAL